MKPGRTLLITVVGMLFSVTAAQAATNQLRSAESVHRCLVNRVSGVTAGTGSITRLPIYGIIWSPTSATHVQLFHSKASLRAKVEFDKQSNPRPYLYTMIQGLWLTTFTAMPTRRESSIIRACIT